MASRYQTDPEYREHVKAKSREYRLKNKERAQANVMAWKRRNPHKVRQYERKRLYGLETIDHLLESQLGLCGVCGEALSEEGRNLHVDHCHSTDRVRGLLCNGCNLRVGWWEFFESNPEYRGKVMQYLGRSSNG